MNFTGAGFSPLRYRKHFTVGGKSRTDQTAGDEFSPLGGVAVRVVADFDFGILNRQDVEFFFAVGNVPDFRLSRWAIEIAASAAVLADEGRLTVGRERGGSDPIETLSLPYRYDIPVRGVPKLGCGSGRRR